jgi:hypothetical protein
MIPLSSLYLMLSVSCPALSAKAIKALVDITTSDIFMSPTLPSLLPPSMPSNLSVPISLTLFDGTLSNNPICSL